MNIIGIVAEYNPFHNGHAYQIHTSKSALGADAVVAVMSGSFMQRGTPAIFDKWTRTELALLGGVNLVIELPTYYSTASAETFAFGAIETLNATGLINHLVYGSEYDDLEAMYQIARLLVEESDEYKHHLSLALSLGNSFPTSRSIALESIWPELPKDIISKPNAILGIEYLKALIRLNSNIIPYPIKRIGSGYHEQLIQTQYSSATAIRNEIIEQKSQNSLGIYKDLSFVMPKTNVIYLEKNHPDIFDFSSYNDILLYKARSTPLESFSSIRGFSEGIEHKLIKEAQRVSDVDTLITRLKSKRYTKTSIHRLLTCMLLDTPKLMQRSPSYIRILGFDAIGKKVLKEMKNTSNREIITNVGRSDALYINDPHLKLDIKSTDVFQLGATQKKIKIGGQDFLRPPIIL